MRTTELRIGNLVDTVYAPKKVRVAEIRDGFVSANYFGKTISSISIESIIPIRLTEEILLKCGFTKREGNNICWDLGTFMIGWYGNSSATWIVGLEQINNSLRFNSQIKYLHQLQNLYFALTGRELEISI